MSKVFASWRKQCDEIRFVQVCATEDGRAIALDQEGRLWISGGSFVGPTWHRIPHPTEADAGDK